MLTAHNYQSTKNEETHYQTTTANSRKDQRNLQIPFLNTSQKTKNSVDEKIK